MNNTGNINEKEVNAKAYEDVWESIQKAIEPFVKILGMYEDYEEDTGVTECKAGSYVGVVSDNCIVPAKVIDVNPKTISIALLRFSLDPNSGEAVEEGADLNNIKTYVYNENGNVKTLSDLNLVLLDE